MKKRRKFAKEEKKTILEKYDMTGHGKKGEFLKSLKITRAHIESWKRQLLSQQASRRVSRRAS